MSAGIKKKGRKLFAFTLALLLVLGQVSLIAPVSPAEAAAGEPALVITGTGLEKDVNIDDSDWGNYTPVERFYSSNNNYDFHKIWKVKGYDLFALIGADNLKADQEYAVKFIASDGFSQTFSVQELKSLYYYPDFTVKSGQPVAPLLGFYRAALFEPAEAGLPSQVAWEDRALTESDQDSNAPRLHLGQAQGDVSDKNQPGFLRDVVRIVVGEERAAADTGPGDGVAPRPSLKTIKLTIGNKEASVDGKPYTLDAAPYIDSRANRTLVPLRFVGEALGAEVDWSSENKQVIITDQGQEIILTIGSQEVLVGGKKQTIDCAALIRPPNHTFVPLRFVSEILGAKVDYKAETKEIAIEMGTVGGEGAFDFTNSPYKHISYESAPYNVDAITGATMTVEGPGVASYRALSLRQIEEADEGLFRGTYAEKIGEEELQNSYEGLPVAYILDNFVKLRPKVGKVVFKDKFRKTIAEFTLDEIRRANWRNNVTGADNLKMIIAYGSNEVPLVYSAEGYIPEKHNGDGCFKLVFGQDTPEAPAPVFSNVSYIYVQEADAPGVYEHATAPYNDPQFTRYIFTLSGSGLGKEINYTVANLEAMTDLHLEKMYSLSNSEHYWYFNDYKGVPLWDLLLKAGLNPNTDESTPVRFIATDYYNIPPLTIGEIKKDKLWGFYEKDEWDMGDGQFDGSKVQPLDTGYPVLVAYGFNGYPYVIHATDPGFSSGLGNDGGPLRIIFGKKNYNHTNGSHQVKYAKKVLIGEDVAYPTHTYVPYNALSESPLTITVIGEDGQTLKQENLKVSDIENMIYGADVPARTADETRVKDYYFTHHAGGASGTKISDLYEGVGLNYLLFEKIGLTGTTGTVTFTGETNDTLTVDLGDILKVDYFNEITGCDDLKPLLAFAKNGYPLVKEKDDPGYVGSGIVNRNGPLMVLFGQTAAGVPGKNLAGVQSITVNLAKDSWAHLDGSYAQYAGQKLTITGSGVRKAHTVTVGELESKQSYIFTGEYCLAKSADHKQTDSYRGLDIYEYIRREVGLQAGASTITVKAADGFSRTFNLAEFTRRDYINEMTGAADLKVMLAFGKNKVPLVPDTASAGYNETAKNSGGPLRLVIGQTQAGDLNSSKAVNSVAEIVVEAAAGDSWKHDYGTYAQYLDQPVVRITGDQVKSSRTFSLRQIEALDEHIVRDLYMGETECEGVILWKLIKDVVGLREGVAVPSSIRVYAGPNYNQLPITSQIMNGVVNSKGETKEIILAYAINGYPLVPHASSPGYESNNEFGPLRSIVEENISMWTKWVDCIVVGDGSYEEPLARDIVK